MVLPAVAPVRPRVIVPETGDVLPLDETIEPFLHGAHGAIEIVGGRGSGKSTALAHLAAVLPPHPRLELLDDAKPGQAAVLASVRLLIYTADAPYSIGAEQSLRLAGWDEDELVEYLLAVHPHQCRSVMQRVHGAPDRQGLGGNPELWRIVLDRMAVDPSLANVSDGLRSHFDAAIEEPTTRHAARVFCFRDRIEYAGPAENLLEQLEAAGCDRRTHRLLLNPTVQLVLAADYLAEKLASPDRSAAIHAFGEATALKQHLRRNMVRETAHRIGRDAKAIEHLQYLLGNKFGSCHALAASILHAAGIAWSPKPGHKLRYAWLSGVRWSGLDLPKIDLFRADLTGADLSGATLTEASLVGVRLRGANLRGARLDVLGAATADLSRADLFGAVAAGADFRGANLEGANLANAGLMNANFFAARLSGACFRGADLSSARLVRAQIDDADFTDANLSGASLDGLALRSARFDGAWLATASLQGSDLEYMKLPEAEFAGASLKGALLTGTSMRRGDFQGANLRSAALAEIDWPKANLRNADLRGATFHMGSSRSGLVHSPIASEGSRTGFYTDEFDQQHYKSPEEIRKANLRGADLRGANIDGVDFYLVDLRGAAYTDQQRDHFRRCGAILVDPA